MTLNVAAAEEPPAPDEPVEKVSLHRNTVKAMIWSLLPGGGHIYLGDTSAGITYASLFTAFAAGGVEVQRRNEDLGRDDDEVNVPLLLADKVWEYSIFTTARSALAADGLDLRAAGFDDTPTPQLLMAPFSRQALRWEVLAAGALGIVGGLAVGHEADTPSLGDVGRVRMFGASYDQDDANKLYAASAFGVSMGAATAEEGLFRGMLQPILQNRLGETPGLWISSGVFGAAHLVGLDGELNLGGAAWATAAGAYLGWLYDRDGNRLAAPIAAHFWYDFLLLSTMWLTAPDENAFGFDVEFRF
ncbi:MAG: lysostaphin resistance A-like protein [Gammaproteobacteria bacterium]